MRVDQYDVVATGCGVAGLSAAIAAPESGCRVALVERATEEKRGGWAASISIFGDSSKYGQRYRLLGSLDVNNNRQPENAGE